MYFPPLRGQGDIAHVPERLLGGQKKGITPELPHRHLGWNPSWEELCMHVGEGPRTELGMVKKSDN